MDKNFKLIIEYDGSRYHGWQRQPNGPTIQEEIEKALTTITKQAVRLIGSGRTDAGVHALGQVANFTCSTRINPEEMMSGLNSLLPEDIAIQHCCLAPVQFHARYDVQSKIYRYTIANQPIRPAIGRKYAWWLRAPLDIRAMQAAAKWLLGRQDFKAFQGTGSPRSHTVRHILAATVEQDSHRTVQLTIQADGFLRYMVRNITGTLVAVGLNKIDVENFRAIIESKDRAQAAVTAPPQGLCLVRVLYGAPETQLQI